MDKAINRAIEGGWKGYIHFTAHREETLERWLAMDLDNDFKEIVLDPLFWQALGKAEGWGTFTGRDRIDFIDDDNFKHYHHECKGRMWHYYWTCFIDHLAEQRPVDAFFNNLLSN